MMLHKTQSIVSWTLQVGVALILLQTLFFKFTAPPRASTSSAGSAWSRGAGSRRASSN